MAVAALARGQSVLFNTDPYDQWDLLIDHQRFQVKLAYQRSDRKSGSLYVDVIRTTKWEKYDIMAADNLAVVVPGEIWVFRWSDVYDLGRVTTRTLMQCGGRETWTIPFQSTT